KLSLLGKRWTPPKSSGILIEDLKRLRKIEEVELHPPETLCDLPRAVERIQQAIQNDERILIVGDYDADGVCASVILFKTLEELRAKVSVRLPHRSKHGYGLNEQFIQEAQDLKVSLIITVDNGISAHKEIELANEFGIDVIVTDHHLPPQQLPNAYAIINPRRPDCPYPNKDLSGAGVAFKLALALLINQELRTANQELKSELLALATIGTVADVCSLTGENRALVKAGLAKIAESKNIGLRAILKTSGLDKSISAEDVGFRIAPRLNAAGRLDDALLAFQTLINGKGAQQLEQLNLDRRQLTEKMLTEAEESLGEIADKRILIASGANFHPGVIGLAAGRLAEKYHRPTIVMSAEKGMLTGSCRSPLPNFNITEALAELEDLLTKFGGHSAAAGFTLLTENREAFAKRLTEIAENKIQAEELIPVLYLDLEVSEADLNFKLLSDLQKLAPFGAGNSEPILLWKSAPLSEVRTVGSDSSHLRLKVGKRKSPAIAFRFGEFAEEISKRKEVDLAFTLAENIWNGSRELQLKITDLI
ncbi:MAG: single-stranded-DNA-specific exonuclease RecJ, partial [Patescibacteria group bacterium]